MIKSVVRPKLLSPSIKVLSLILILTYNSLAWSQTYQVYTENIPPFQEMANNQVSGSVTQLVQKVFDCSNLKTEINILPWNRAVDSVLKNPNSLIYSIARTPDRELLFNWIGPVLETQINLYKLKSRADIKITSFDDIRKYRLGLLPGGFITQIFIDNNFVSGVHFNLNDSDESRVNMLFAGRYDLIDTMEIQIENLLKKTPYTRADLAIAMPLVTDLKLYLAINKSANIQIVEKLKACLKKETPIISTSM